MEETQIIKYVAALIGAMGVLIVALAGAARLFTSLIKKATEGERTLQNERMTDLKTSNDRLLTRVADLEESHKKDQQRITVTENENAGMHKQVDTLCTQIESLQLRVEASEKLAQDKQKVIDQQAQQIEHQEKQNTDLFEANKTLTIERNTYRSSLALVGSRLAELDAKESAEKKLKNEEAAGEVPAPETQETKPS